MKRQSQIGMISRVEYVLSEPMTMACFAEKDLHFGAEIPAEVDGNEL